MATPAPTVGSFLFDYLYNQGVRHAFGIPGDFALPTFRWLEASKLDLLTMTHEPSVGFAADAYARVHGLGVACVTYCVGGLNMLNPIACAYAEKSPVIVISGGPSPSDRKHDALVHHKVRTFDTQRRIYDEVTCASAVRSRKLAKRVKCAGDCVWSTSSSGRAVVRVVGVSKASMPSIAAANCCFIVSRRRSASM